MKKFTTKAKQLVQSSVQFFLLFLCILGAISLSTMFKESMSEEKDIISISRDAIKEHLDYPDSAKFDTPIISTVENISKIEGYFTVDTKGGQQRDMVYTLALVKINEKEWKVVHLSLNGRILLHTLAE